MGKAGGPAVSLQELSAVFNGWYAAEFEPSGYRKQQGARGAAGREVAEWPGLKVVKALMGQENDPEAALLTLQDSLK
jgi:hypothetical protein